MNNFSSKTDKFLKKQTQIHRWLPLYFDRFLEVLKLYPLSLLEFIKICINYDFPNTKVFKHRFIKNFGPSGPSALFNSYKRLDKHYILRLMLTYHRLDLVSKYLDYIYNYFPARKIRVLDYGCGVADIGLYFAILGNYVTLVDLATPKFEFTKKRFIVRGLDFNYIDIKNTEALPTINEKFDLIIATEILEHYRYPTKLVNLFYFILNRKGLLLNSLGLDFVCESGADHLDESLEEMKSENFMENYSAKFELIDIPDAEPWLFMKRE